MFWIFASRIFVYMYKAKSYYKTCALPLSPYYGFFPIMDLFKSIMYLFKSIMDLGP